MSKQMRVALVAHDKCKPDLLEWAEYNKGTLGKHYLIGTGTTGRLVSEKLELPVECLLSGPLGGDQQIGAMIADNKIDLLVFFCDPLSAAAHEPDIRALLRLASVWNTPIAINRASADMVISSPLFHDEYTPETPDYASHTTRPLPTDTV